MRILNVVWLVTMTWSAVAWAADPIPFVRTPDAQFENLPGYTFEPHYMTVDGDLRMRYVDVGPADAPPILLLHDEPSWSYLYRKMIPPLAAAGYRVIAPDLIGFGRSDKPTNRSDYTYPVPKPRVSGARPGHLLGSASGFPERAVFRTVTRLEPVPENQQRNGSHVVLTWLASCCHQQQRRCQTSRVVKRIRSTGSGFERYEPLRVRVEDQSDSSSKRPAPFVPFSSRNVVRSRGSPRSRLPGVEGGRSISATADLPGQPLNPSPHPPRQPRTARAGSSPPVLVRWIVAPVSNDTISLQLPPPGTQLVELW